MDSICWLAQVLLATEGVLLEGDSVSNKRYPFPTSAGTLPQSNYSERVFGTTLGLHSEAGSNRGLVQTCLILRGHVEKDEPNESQLIGPPCLRVTTGRLDKSALHVLSLFLGPLQLAFAQPQSGQAIAVTSLAHTSKSLSGNNYAPPLCEDKALV